MGARGLIRLVLLTTAGLAAAPTAQAAPAVIRDGNARFEVLTPTLIRAEYAADRRFENRPTMVATRGRLPTPHVTTTVRGRVRIIRTSALTLRWKRGSPDLSTLTLGSTRVAPGPRQANLGGWTRALDNQTKAVPLHDGVLSRDGWYVLDDTATALLVDSPPGFVVRPRHDGAYADWYVFGYGRDYQRGLRDLRALTGPAPLLPRSAFGVWFSRYYPYSDGELRALVGEFRKRDVPLDTLSIDTDYKAVHDPAGAAIAAAVAGAPGKPFSWNAWEWNTSLFPDPKGFADWAHGQGLSLVANVHPTIDTNDPRYPAVAAQTGGAMGSDTGQCRILQADATGTCKVFDWTKAPDLAAYFGLHSFIDDAGIDMTWLDWCCDGPQRDTPGLTPDTWINSRYAAHQRARGTRWPAFSRIGGHFVPGPADDGDSEAPYNGAFAEHRYSIQFTGDTCATWEMLAFEAKLSAAEGNIGLPYVSHDIGSFNGEPAAGSCSAFTALGSQHLPDDLYARWVQFGTFQPLDRLHSNHGDRLPWEYGAAADASATSALRLREALVPYTYTLARRAHDTGLPITGSLFLTWPRQPAAYRHPSEFTYGPDVVVAPVTAPGDPAPVTLWIPPGTWVDYFTGQRFTGPREQTLQVPLLRLPVLVRAGAILPTQGNVLTIYGRGGRGSLSLYDDAGVGFGYERGQRRFTPITHSGSRLEIGAARGTYPGAPARRRWTVRVAGSARSRQITVPAGRAVTIRLP